MTEHRTHDAVRIQITRAPDNPRRYQAQLRGDGGVYVSPIMQRFSIDRLVEDAVLVASDHSACVSIEDRTGDHAPDFTISNGG